MHKCRVQHTHHPSNSEVYVGFVARIRNFRRWWRRYRVRLRRDRVAVTLLVLLTLGLGEPLLCIIHCQIWLPIAFLSYFAAQHPHAHHHDHAHMTVAPTDQSVEQAAGAAITSSVPAEHTMCAFQGGPGQGSVPFHVPPD